MRPGVRPTLLLFQLHHIVIRISIDQLDQRINTCLLREHVHRQGGFHASEKFLSARASLLLNPLPCPLDMPALRVRLANTEPQCEAIVQPGMCEEEIA